MILSVEDIRLDFAGLVALDDVSFTVDSGSVTSLIGPNGAGKTTLVNIITGILRPNAGDVRFDGHSVRGLSTSAIARRGIRRTFQTVRLFPSLSVLENLQLAQYSRIGTLRSLLPASALSPGENDRCAELLSMFKLYESRNAEASRLSYGDQRRVEIARALAGNPRLVLLDEPAAGMNERETDQLRSDIALIRESGVTVFLIEHDMSLVLSVSDKVVVLDFGRKIAEGPPAEVKVNPEVIASYLGAMPGTSEEFHA